MSRNLRIVERTTPRPGDKFIIGHRTVTANERGGWDEVEPVAHPPAGPAMPLHTMAQEATDFLLIVFAVLVVAFFAGWAAIEWLA